MTSSTLDFKRAWTWITRRVEPTIAKWMNRPAAVILIRGQRRSGKSSTVKVVATQLNMKYIELHVRSDRDRDEMLQEFNAKLSAICGSLCQKKLECLYDYKNAVLNLVKAGYVVILKGLHYASNSTQVTLQELFDSMAFQSMHDSMGWACAGCIFIMGSQQNLIDSMCGSHTSPLFQRKHGIVTVCSFDTLEMTRLFRRLGITAGNVMLSLHSVFGGNPSAYEQAFRVGTLDGNYTNVENLIKEFLASGLQQEYNDPAEYLVIQHGKMHAAGLKAVHDNEGRTQQVAALKHAITLEPAHAGDDPFNAGFVILNELYSRYRLIEPVYSLANLIDNLISRYDVVEPSCLLALRATAKPSNVSLAQMNGGREDVSRSVSVNPEDICWLEKFHLEAWMQEIAEHRQHLLHLPAFPGINGAKCLFLPRVKWDVISHDYKSFEIDVFGCQPETSTLLIGSCKGGAGQTDDKNLEDNFSNLQNSAAMQLVMGYFGMNGYEKVHYFHLVPTIRNEVSLTRRYPVISLEDMLAPFFGEIAKQDYLNIDQSRVNTTTTGTALDGPTTNGYDRTGCTVALLDLNSINAAIAGPLVNDSETISESGKIRCTVTMFLATAGMFFVPVCLKLLVIAFA
jgi:hypothetical protein